MLRCLLSKTQNHYNSGHYLQHLHSLRWVECGDIQLSISTLSHNIWSHITLLTNLLTDKQASIQHNTVLKKRYKYTIYTLYTACTLTVDDIAIVSVDGIFSMLVIINTTLHSNDQCTMLTCDFLITCSPLNLLGQRRTPSVYHQQ